MNPMGLADLIFFGITGNYCAIRFSRAVSFELKQPAENQKAERMEKKPISNIGFPPNQKLL